MKTLDASSVDHDDLARLEDIVKAMPQDSSLWFFLAALAGSLRGGDDVIAGKPSDLVTPAQAAKLLGISRVHLYKIMDAGEIPSVNVGRDRRLTLGDVESFMDERDAAGKEMAERFARSGTVREAAIDALQK